MEQKAVTYKTIKGMSRDMAVSSGSNDYSYENYNIRITTRGKEDSLAVTNEKGTEDRIIATRSSIAVVNDIKLDRNPFFYYRNNDEYIKQEADIKLVDKVSGNYVFNDSFLSIFKSRYNTASIIDVNYDLSVSETEPTEYNGKEYWLIKENEFDKHEVIINDNILFNTGDSIENIKRAFRNNLGEELQNENNIDDLDKLNVYDIKTDFERNVYDFNSFKFKYNELMFNSTEINNVVSVYKSVYSPEFNIQVEDGYKIWENTIGGQTTNQLSYNILNNFKEDVISQAKLYYNNQEQTEPSVTTNNTKLKFSNGTFGIANGLCPLGSNFKVFKVGNTENDSTINYIQLLYNNEDTGILHNGTSLVEKSSGSLVNLTSITYSNGVLTQKKTFNTTGNVNNFKLNTTGLYFIKDTDYYFITSGNDAYRLYVNGNQTDKYACNLYYNSCKVTNYFNNITYRSEGIYIPYYICVKNNKYCIVKADTYDSGGSSSQSTYGDPISKSSYMLYTINGTATLYFIDDEEKCIYCLSDKDGSTIFYNKIDKRNNFSYLRKKYSPYDKFIVTIDSTDYTFEIYQNLMFYSNSSWSATNYYVNNKYYGIINDFDSPAFGTIITNFDVYYIDPTTKTKRQEFSYINGVRTFDYTTIVKENNSWILKGEINVTDGITYIVHYGTLSDASFSLPTTTITSIQSINDGVEYYNNSTLLFTQNTEGKIVKGDNVYSLYELSNKNIDYPIIIMKNALNASDNNIYVFSGTTIIPISSSENHQYTFANVNGKHYTLEEDGFNIDNFSVNETTALPIIYDGSANNTSIFSKERSYFVNMDYAEVVNTIGFKTDKFKFNVSLNNLKSNRSNYNWDGSYVYKFENDYLESNIDNKGYLTNCDHITAFDNNKFTVTLVKNSSTNILERIIINAEHNVSYDTSIILLAKENSGDRYVKFVRYMLSGTSVYDNPFDILTSDQINCNNYTIQITTICPLIELYEGSITDNNIDQLYIINKNGVLVSCDDIEYIGSVYKFKSLSVTYQGVDYDHIESDAKMHYMNNNDSDDNKINYSVKSYYNVNGTTRERLDVNQHTDIVVADHIDKDGNIIFRSLVKRSPVCNFLIPEIVSGISYVQEINSFNALTIPGKILGSCTIEEYVVLFFHYSAPEKHEGWSYEQYMKAKRDENGDFVGGRSQDYIIRMKYFSAKDNDNELAFINGEWKDLYTGEIIETYEKYPYYGAEILYAGNLNFNFKHGIETIGYYESKDVIKVYWTDGLNQPRFINIMDSAEKRSKYEQDSFDFVRKISGIETLKINKRYGGGAFPAGTVQYYFTYSNKNGAETNPFISSGILYTSPINKGGSPINISDNIFDIELNNLSDKYEFVNIYSVVRTTKDMQPLCKKVMTLSYSGKSIFYTDNNLIGEIVDSTKLLMMQNTPVSALTFTEKDNTLFLGNINKLQKALTSEQKKKIKRCFESELHQGYKMYQNYNPDDDSWYENKVENDKISIDKNSRDIKTFMLDEYYRLGIQFQDSYGMWTEPIYIGDIKCTLQVKNKIYEIINGDSTKTVDKLGSIIPYFYASFNYEGELKNICEEFGFVKVRPVIVYPNISSRNVLCQGLLNPTMFNYSDREINAPYNFASYFFRPIPPASLNEESIGYDGGNNTDVFPIENRHGYPISGYRDIADENWPISSIQDSGDELGGFIANYIKGQSTNSVKLSIEFPGVRIYNTSSSKQYSIIRSGKFKVSNNLNNQNKPYISEVIESCSLYIIGHGKHRSELIYGGTLSSAATPGSINTNWIEPSDETYISKKYIKDVPILKDIFEGDNDVEIISHGDFFLESYAAYGDKTRFIDYGSVGNIYCFSSKNHIYINEGTVWYKIAYPLTITINTTSRDREKKIRVYKRKVYCHDVLIESNSIEISASDNVQNYIDEDSAKHKHAFFALNNGEIQCANGYKNYNLFDDNFKRINNDFGGASEINIDNRKQSMFYIDENVCTLNSPEIEYDPTIQTIDLSNYKLRIVGAANITGGDTNISIDVETGPAIIKTTVCEGEKIDVDSVTNFNKEAYKYRLSGGFWYDSVAKASDDEMIDESSIIGNQYCWWVYPFNRGILNNSIGGKYGKIRYKRWYNYHYSAFSDYFPASVRSSSKLLYRDISAKQVIDVHQSVMINTAWVNNECMYIGSMDTAYVDPKTLVGVIGGSGDKDDNAFNQTVAISPNCKIKTKAINDTKTYSLGDYNGDMVALTFNSTNHFVLSLGDNNNYANVLPDFYYNDNLISNKYSNAEAETNYYSTKDDYADITNLVPSDDSKTKGIVRKIVRLDNKNDYSKDFDNVADIDMYNNIGLYDYGHIYIAQLERNVSSSFDVFGDSSESTLMLHTWIPCGNAIELNGNIKKIDWQEGDTYYQRYDCLKTYAHTGSDVNQVIESLSAMIQTRINLDGIYLIRGASNNLGANNTNTNILNQVYTQDDNYFTYSITDPYISSITEYSNMFTWTMTKQVMSSVDSWTAINLIAYYNATGSFGKITRLINFRNTIYCFQTNGISQIAYNERVALSPTDGVPIEIGNSGKVQGLNYISSDMGCQNRWSVVTTKQGLYWVDDRRAEIYKIGGESGIEPFSTINGFSDWVKANTYGEDWKPIKETDTPITSYYDNNSDDVYFVTDKDCLAFNEKLNAFESFYCYEDSFILNSNGNTLLIREKDNVLFDDDDNPVISDGVPGNGTSTVYILHEGEYNKFFGKQYPYYVRFKVYPTDLQRDKIFTNLEYNADAYDVEDVYIADNSFTRVRIWDEYQWGEFDFSNSIYGTTEFKKRFRTFYVQLPRSTHSVTKNYELNNRIYRWLDNSDYRTDRIRNPWCWLELYKQTYNYNKIQTSAADFALHKAEYYRKEYIKYELGVDKFFEQDLYHKVILEGVTMYNLVFYKGDDKFTCENENGIFTYDEIKNDLYYVEFQNCINDDNYNPSKEYYRYICDNNRMELHDIILKYFEA